MIVGSACVSRASDGPAVADLDLDGTNFRSDKIGSEAPDARLTPRHR
jgi:hypothetical protein